ncbi:MAG TPA: hypothetical protein VLF67_00155, partial [Candidatus Saccharimonas sp.]|nr:hypothetical protein [Candidatus Saccharimonas sp.]
MPEHLPPTGSESFHPAVDPAELVSAPDEHPEAAQSIAALVEDDHEPVVVVPPAPRNAHDLTPGERKLIGEGAKDRKQLQEIFDPLSIAGAQHLKAMLEANPAECRERIRDRPFALAPYGEVYIKLPPGFFGDQPPAVPAGVGTDEARRLATAFIDRITREGTAEEKRFFQLTPDDYRRDDTINLLTNRMNQLQYDGEVIYPDQWRQYEDTYQSFKDRNKEGDMFMVYLNRTFNTHRRYSAATGRNKDFVLTSTDTEYHTMPYGVIITPVGDYGPEFARDLGRTTAYAIEVLDRAVQDDAQ